MYARTSVLLIPIIEQNIKDASFLTNCVYLLQQKQSEEKETEVSFQCSHLKTTCCIYAFKDHTGDLRFSTPSLNFILPLVSL